MLSARPPQLLPDEQELRRPAACVGAVPKGRADGLGGTAHAGRRSRDRDGPAARVPDLAHPTQAHPIDGVCYDHVPRCPLRYEEPAAQTADRWAWKIQRARGVAGRRGGCVVHVWDCEDAPQEAEELDVFAALDVLRRPGTVACTECGADGALGPLLQWDLRF